jgi:ribonuclease HI
VKVVVNVDGGARGNPGPAAVAAVATTPKGESLAERNGYIGETTNKVVNDSELVARQIGGEYKVKHAGLKPLYLDAMRSLREFDGWAVRAVRRDENSRADELVNEALDDALSR